MADVLETAVDGREVAERAVGEEVDEEGEEEEEAEEEEPVLKYNRFNKELVKRLGPQTSEDDHPPQGPVELISCVAVHSKFIILGMDSGKILILSVSGDKIPGYDIDAHSSPIVSLSVDEEGEHIASCAQDGKVIISGLLSAQNNIVLNLSKPVQAVAFAPHFSKLKSPSYVTGSDELVMFEERKGVLKLQRKTTVLHGGEGKISTIKWQHLYIAWANDRGVYVYDTSLKTIISRVSRERDYPKPKISPCHLYWKSDYEILIGWADRVKVGVIKYWSDTTQAHSPLNGGASGTDARKQLCICHNIHLEHGLVAGVAPFANEDGGNDMVILQYMLTTEEDKKTGVPSGQREAPQMVVLRPKGYSDSPEEVCRDQLPVRGFNIYNCNDYMLAYDEDGARLYVVAPMDMVVVQKRTVDDHVGWLMEHEKYEAAMTLCEQSARELKAYSIEMVGKHYVDCLLREKDFKDAAMICARAYKQSTLEADKKKKLWDDAVYSFIQCGALSELLLYIPISDPQLGPETYEYIIYDSLKTSPEVVCSIINAWPSDIYNLKAILMAVEDTLKEKPDDVILLRVTAELYAKQGEFGQAIGAYLKLGHPDIFGLIREHELYEAALRHLKELLVLDEMAAVNLLVDVREKIEPDLVVKILEMEKTELDQHHLHCYLDALFHTDSKAATHHHFKQVELYAKFEPKKLLPFLQVCTNVPLKEAEQVCERYDLFECKIYILKRMGNYRKAIETILSRAKHRDEAVTEAGMKQAIDIALELGEEDLLAELVKAAKDNAIFARTLLSEAGTVIDASSMIKKMNPTMYIPGLRSTIVKLLQDYGLQASLREGCITILRKDCDAMMRRYIGYWSRGMRVEDVADCPVCEGDVFDSVGLKPSTVFGCGHVYHTECIQQPQEALNMYCVICRPHGRRRGQRPQPPK